MAQAENKTSETERDVAAFLAAREAATKATS